MSSLDLFKSGRGSFACHPRFRFRHRPDAIAVEIKPWRTCRAAGDIVADVALIPVDGIIDVVKPELVARIFCNGGFYVSHDVVL